MSDMEFIKSSKDAIEALSKIRWLAEHSDSCNTVEIDAVYDEALEFAINNLGAYKQVAWEHDIAIQQLHELGYEFGQKIEPTTKGDLEIDCISRQEALNACHNFAIGILDDYYEKCLKQWIIDLPPITPIRPKGHWIGHREHCENLGVMPSGLGAYEWCSNCDCGIDVREWHRNHYNYCPNCGADMRGEEV